MAALAERPLSELLAEVAAHTPAPGGGCASAWAGALAAALAEMAASFLDDAPAAGRAAVLREELLASGERELHSYEPVLEAYRLPKTDPTRSAHVRAALSEASATPLAIARACAEVAELASAAAEKSNPSIRGDAVAGALLAEAASRAAGRLVEINLAHRRDDTRIEEVSQLAERAESARERALGSL